jgi:predicted AAA+ superfamily ATPase
MTTHYLDNWKQYLYVADYNYLIQYIENIKNNIPNDRMIILSGPGRSGKSTLQTDITKYLGNGFFCEIDEIYRSKKSNQAIVNFIKYKQSFIASTNHIEKIPVTLLEYSKIINMTHIF